ncbi:MAG: hypothetical protein R3B09_13590 [Nannocystaceae bacterium]
MPEAPVNTPRFALVTGVDPIHDWHPHLDLPADLAAIEVAVIAGPILGDVDYISDYSGPSPDGRHRRYRGLEDVLDPQTLAHTRARLAWLLESLLDDHESWFLFVHGGLGPDFDEPSARFHAQVHADPLPFNGDFTLFEVPVGELDHYAPLFGACDRVAGLAAPAGSFAAVLDHLSLGAAVPTGQRYRFGSPYHLTDTTALARVLAHGRLFFEETDNGTRLRLITATPAIDRLRERLAALLEGT